MGSSMFHYQCQGFIKHIKITATYELHIPHLKALILTSVNVLLILILLGAHKCGVLRPRWKGHPCVIQNLQQQCVQLNLNYLPRTQIKFSKIDSTIKQKARNEVIQ